jgi:hypothetical protein
MDAVALKRPPALAGPALGLAGAATYAAANLGLDPFATHEIATHEIGCPFLAVTGLWCPGCGSSRAANLILHGDLTGAFHYHPFVVPVLLLLAYLWVGWVVRRAAPHRAAPWRSASQLPTWAPLGIGVAFAALWVLRNLPGLDFLAPPT